MRSLLLTGCFLSVLLFSCNSETEMKNNESNIDARSYNLGIIGAFSELVNVGVKKLALSEALPPEEMDKLAAEAEKIAERNHVKLHREKDLIITWLFPADVAVGKDVFLIYNGSTKDEYLSLKEEIKNLEASGKYSDSARLDISIRFGKMLSYPQAKIDELIAGNPAKREDPRQSRDRK